MAKGPVGAAAQVTVDFFDEDDPPTRDEPIGDRRPRRAPAVGARSAPSGPGGPSRQQIRTRQLTFIGGAIVVFILLVLAVRGCLDARKERSFTNYVSDLSSLTTETDQLSDSFFKLLGGKSDQTDLSFESEVAADRGTAQGLLDRAENLDAPDELESAQRQIDLSYELRHDALEAIAANTDDAFGDKKVAAEATEAIANQMKVLLASDVLFKRAHDEIEQALADQEITVEEGVPESQFLPDPPPDYLDVDAVASALAGVGASGATGSADCSGGTSHGTGIESVSVGGTAVTPDTPATVPVGDVEVTVANQGQAPESDIEVTAKLSGGSSDISGSGTIKSISDGESQAVTIPLRPAPGAGETYDMDIDVAEVPCEGVSTNNKATYPITFG